MRQAFEATRVATAAFATFTYVPFVLTHPMPADFAAFTRTIFLSRCCCCRRRRHHCCCCCCCGTLLLLLCYALRCCCSCAAMAMTVMAHLTRYISSTRSTVLIYCCTSIVPVYWLYTSTNQYILLMNQFDERVYCSRK